MPAAESHEHQPIAADLACTSACTEVPSRSANFVTGFNCPETFLCAHRRHKNTLLRSTVPSSAPDIAPVRNSAAITTECAALAASETAKVGSAEFAAAAGAATVAGDGRAAVDDGCGCGGAAAAICPCHCETAAAGAGGCCGSCGSGDAAGEGRRGSSAVAAATWTPLAPPPLRRGSAVSTASSSPLPALRLAANDGGVASAAGGAGATEDVLMLKPEPLPLLSVGSTDAVIASSCCCLRKSSSKSPSLTYADRPRGALTCCANGGAGIIPPNGMAGIGGSP